MNKNKLQQETKKIVEGQSYTQMTGSVGVVISYDRYNNTATVAVTENESNTISEIVKNVPCPFLPGMQGLDPQPGWEAWIVYKNGKITTPCISHFFNHAYSKYIYESQNKTEYGIPFHLMD